MVAPDHWVPVTVISNRKSYARPRTLLIASAIGFAHGMSSTVLSLAIAEIGALFFPVHYVNLSAVFLLLVIAAYVIISAIRASRSGTKAESVSMLVSIIPDPALVPFILVARGFGVVYTGILVSAFVVTAVASLALVVFLAALGLSKSLSRIKPQYIDYLVALALILVAAFVYISG